MQEVYLQAVDIADQIDFRFSELDHQHCTILAETEELLLQGYDLAVRRGVPAQAVNPPSPARDRHGEACYLIEIVRG